MPTAIRVESDVDLVGGGCDVLGLLLSTVGADEGGLLLIWAIPDLDVVVFAHTVPNLDVVQTAGTQKKLEVLELEEHLEPVGHLDLPSACCVAWVVLRVVG